MPCAACGTPNRAGRKFCAECGAALALACAVCGSANEAGERFCGECGSALGGEAPAPPPVDARGTEVRHVSVLFCDLVGYTSLSETRDAEDVREVLSGYFDVARTVVTRYGGTIEKFIGDAVMAVWGVPAALEDDAQRAVRAALDLVGAVQVYGDDVGLRLRARAGVVTGRAASVNNPLEGIVVGDRVNTAARVQSVAEPGTVLVDGVTRESTAGAIEYTDAGLHEVKGKAEPLQLWRAERVVAGVGGNRIAEGPEAPLVGRARELAVIKELFHACAEEGRARLLALTGAPGAGKSRLFWEFDKYIDGLAGTFLWHTGQCLAYGEGVAYWALAEMVRQRFEIAQDDSLDRTREKVTAGLHRWVPDPAARAFIEPRVGVLLGIDDVRMPQEELFAGWRMLIEKLAAISPVILAFEDMQWADPGLVQFIEQLLDWSAHVPIFVLVMARAELVERHPELVIGRASVTILSLDPLSDVAIGTLFDQLIPRLPRTSRTMLVERAAGIPLYAIEIVRSLVERGLVVTTADGPALVGELDDVQLPGNLTGLLAARIDALPPAERALVRALSVLGGSFPRSAAEALSELPPDEVGRALAGLVRKDVFTVQRDPLSPDQGHYAFGQALLRAAAYATLSKQERRQGHLRAAENLRSSFAGDGEDVVEVVAAHYRDAWEAVPDAPDADAIRALAAESYGRAGRRAAAVGAPLTAEQAYRTAAGLADRDGAAGRWLIEAARMGESSGRYEEALGIYEQLAGHLAPGRSAAMYELVARTCGVLVSLGRSHDAEQRLRATLADADPDDPRTAALVITLGRCVNFRGATAELGAVGDRGLLLAAAAGDPALLAEAAGVRADGLSVQNRAAEALVMYRWATEELGEALAPSAKVRLLLNASDMHMSGDLPGAEERMRFVLDECRRLGNALAGQAAGNLAALHLLAGRWEDARRLLEESVQAPSLEEYGAMVLIGQQAQLHALLGDVETARDRLDQLRSWEQSEDPQARASVDFYAGVIAAAEGDDEEAMERCARVARTSLTGLGMFSELFRTGWPVAVDLALRLGRIEEAAELIRLVAVRPIGFVPPFLRAQLARFQGRLAAVRGADADAEVGLREAVRVLAELGYPYWLALAQADLAAELRRTGRDDEAGPLLDEAVTTLTRLGAVPVLRALGLPVRG